jgi:hypothetical protein
VVSHFASAAISKISVERGEDVDRRGRARARTGAKRNAKSERAYFSPKVLKKLTKRVIDFDKDLKELL